MLNAKMNLSRPGKWICIDNIGEIESRALTLLGGTTKKGAKNMIGMFGSGNKYAIAFMLRNDIPFCVFSGERQIPIEVHSTWFREKEMKVIVVDHHETSLTIDTGPGWEAWQVLREIVCNAVDEGDPYIYYTNMMEGVLGRTRFYILADSPVVKINFDEYFLTDRGYHPVWTSQDGKRVIYPAPSSTPQGTCYRYGIQVAERGYVHPVRQIPFDVNNDDFDIDEVRNLVFSLETDIKIWRTLLECNSQSVIESLLPSLNSVFIPSVVRDTTNSDSISETWKQILKERTFYTPLWKNALSSSERENCVLASDHVITTMQLIVGRDNVRIPVRVRDGVMYEKLAMSTTQARQVERAVNRLIRVDIMVNLDSIILGEMVDPEIIAFACRKTRRIVLSPRAFMRGGLDDLTISILEEHIHLKYGSIDYSREMQETLLSLIVTLITRIEDTQLLQPQPR